MIKKQIDSNEKKPSIEVEQIRLGKTSWTNNSNCDKNKKQIYKINVFLDA